MVYILLSNNIATGYKFQIYTYKFFIYTYKFITRGVHGIYTPAIEQSDWSECTSHGTNFRYTPTSFIYTYKFFTRGIHEIYTPAIEQSDWSECTSHGTREVNVHDLVTRMATSVFMQYLLDFSLLCISLSVQ